MTTPKPDLLNARHALALAFDIVSTPCSAAETQRAEVLLGIAREIREEQQYRSLRGLRADLARVKLGAPSDQPAGPSSSLRVPAAAETTAYMPAFAEQTQRLPIVWHLGDKADCRHCHTPIVYDARRMQDPVTKQEADPQYLWIHKYTDQRACAVATMSSDDAEPTHTFAEPSV